MNRYPDMGCTALYAALADRLGVPPTHLAAGTGSVAVLYHLLQAFCEPGDEVVYAWRSFEAYPIAVAVPGAVSVQVPLTADARHDLDAMAAAVTDRTRVVIVCSPNNPTGPSVRRAELEAFLDRVPSHVVVVLDEAYREFVRDEDPFDGVDLYRARRQRGGDAHVREGLRPGRLPGRLRRRARADRRRGAGLRAAVRRLVGRPGRRGRLAGARGRAARPGARRIVAERDAGGRGAARTRAGACPDAQGNFVWLPLGDRAPRLRGRRGAGRGHGPARSPATASGSASASRPATTCCSTSLRASRADPEVD